MSNIKTTFTYHIRQLSIEIDMQDCKYRIKHNDTLGHTLMKQYN